MRKTDIVPSKGVMICRVCGQRPTIGNYVQEDRVHVPIDLSTGKPLLWKRCACDPYPGDPQNEEEMQQRMAEARRLSRLGLIGRKQGKGPFRKKSNPISEVEFRRPTSMVSRH